METVGKGARVGLAAEGNFGFLEKSTILKHLQHFENGCLRGAFYANIATSLFGKALFSV